MDEQSKSMIAFGILLIVYGIASAIEAGWKPTRPRLPDKPKVNFDYLAAIRDHAIAQEHHDARH